MGFMPVPADDYFSDFAMDVLEYSVFRDGKQFATYDGLTNKDKNGKYIGFKMACDIRIGDVLEQDGDRYAITAIRHDHYNGEPEMIKAYY